MSLHWKCNNELCVSNGVLEWASNTRCRVAALPYYNNTQEH